MITQERLKELLDYDPEDGWFRYRVSRSNIRVGKIAGCYRRGGYWVIRIDGKLYYAHRLAWLYMTGKFSDEIDHIDLDGTHNRWSNLREATHSQNLANIKRPQHNSTGFKGVTWHNDRYIAQIHVDQRHIHLGIFDTPEEAHAAYIAAARRYFGEFANDGRLRGE